MWTTICCNYWKIKTTDYSKCNIHSIRKLFWARVFHPWLDVNCVWPAQSTALALRFLSVGPPPTELCWKRHQSSSLSRARRRLTRILIYRCHVAWTPDEFVPPRGISNVVVLSLAWRLWELGPFKASLLEKENSINKGSKRTEHHDWALNAGLLPVMWSKWLLYSCNKSWSGTYYAESMGTKSTRWGKNWIGWYI